jgi:hypothetical protein
MLGETVWGRRQLAEHPGPVVLGAFFPGGVLDYGAAGTRGAAQLGSTSVNLCSRNARHPNLPDTCTPADTWSS